MRTPPLIVLLLTSILIGSSSPGVLFTLASPNEQEEGRFGWAVSGVADVNSDGVNDILVGAYGEGLGTGLDRAGRVYVFSGTSGEILTTLVSPNPESYGYFGFSGVGIGDVDGDGSGDLAIGAVFEDPDLNSVNAGKVYIASGVSGAVLRVLVSPNQETCGHFGYSLDNTGDVDGDGFDDVVIGAFCEDPGARPLNAGRAYVFGGNDGSLIHSLVSPEEEEEGRFGTVVSGVGDVNGDGFDDLLVGAPDASPAEAGRVYIFSGQTGHLLHTLHSPNEEACGRFGGSVCRAGDVDIDGFADIAVSAPGEGGGGRVYVFGGLSGDVLRTLVNPFGDAGFAYFGRSIAYAGDVNSDGYPDIMISVLAEEGRQLWGGVVCVFSGQTADTLCTLTSPAGGLNSSGFGWTLSPIGDQDGDGSDDVVIGAYSESPGISPYDAGRVYVFTCQPSPASHGDNIGSSALEIIGPIPNPTTGAVRLGLRFAGKEHERITIDLYDAMGRLVDTVLSETSQGGDYIDLHWTPDEQLPSGAYWWCATSGGRTTRKRMIIMR